MDKKVFPLNEMEKPLYKYYCEELMRQARNWQAFDRTSPHNLTTTQKEESEFNPIYG